MGGNCPSGSCTRGNYPGAIGWGLKVLGELSWGEFHEGKLSGGQLSKREFSLTPI